MDNNLSTKLRTVENNIAVMKTNWGLSKTDSIETLTETAQKYAPITPVSISFKNSKATEQKGIYNLDVSEFTSLKDFFARNSNLLELNLEG